MSKTDSNCIQILAPVDSTEESKETFICNEHIGLISREFSVVIAPLLDQFASSNNVAFKLSLLYSDTNHSRVGYDLDLVVCCKDNSHVITKFTGLKLINNTFFDIDLCLTH